MDRREWPKPVALEDFYSTGPFVYCDHEGEHRREKIRAKVSALKMRLGLRERMEHDA